MKVIRGIRNYKRSGPGAVVAVGVFDGLHPGHRKVIGKAVAEARKTGCRSVVITFDPHPAKVLRPERRLAPSLISLAHRIRLIAKLEVDEIVVLNFTRALAGMGAEDFVRKVLMHRLGARAICVGDNFSFGRSGRAGALELIRIGRKCGIKAHILSPFRIDGEVVSSSLIRKAVTSGDLAKAARLLGRGVSVLGTVVSGARFARELGYPTANLNPHHEVIPPSGVYAVYVYHKDARYEGVLNIGVRPTFYAPRDQEPAIEVHIFGFKGNIYGSDLEVVFVKKLRDEAAFAGRDELVFQIRKDEAAAKKALASLRDPIDCA